MTRTPAPTHPLRALAALIATAAALHGICAHASEKDFDGDELAQVHVSGHRLSVRTACPAVDEELPDDLVQAWQDHGAATAVPVEFKLRGNRIYEVQLATESPRLSRQVRREIRDMSCDGGDDEIHTVDLVVRFTDPAAPRDDVTHVAIDASDD